ncbi:Hypothetical predicted protein [Octopus vulgaris]|uniref:Uncharacterized protein n=1 Tax=Octopus vulgaris TaxID=6645 RepID=A0AA36FBT1_OCTVU|nr:Hypothetical predicted protein [Octopus vulgaris]
MNSQPCYRKRLQNKVKQSNTTWIIEQSEAEQHDLNEAICRFVCDPSYCDIDVRKLYVVKSRQMCEGFRSKQP